MSELRIIEADGGAFVSGRRLRARRCEPRIPAGRSAGAVAVTHGGGVADKYGYPAETEACLSCRMGDCVVVWRARLPAKHVTYRGAAEACLSGSGDRWDNRVTNPARELRATRRIQDAALRVLAFQDKSKHKPYERLTDDPLLPCPHCGGEADYYSGWPGGDPKYRPDYRDPHICCAGCGCGFSPGSAGFGVTDLEAERWTVDAWNRRAEAANG